MRQKRLIFSLVFLVLLCNLVPSIASSQTVEDLRTAMENAEDVLYNDSYGAYTYAYMWSYNRLEKMISDVKTAIRGLGGIQLTPTLHPATQAADAIAKIGTAVQLTDEIRAQLVNIETQREITEMLWVGNEDWYGVERAWVDFENAVNAYNEKVSVNRIVYPPEKRIATELYFCYGPCDELFETASLAQVSHSVYCSEKHGSSGTTGVTFYICSSSGTCDRSDEHWLVCGGTCGNEFAPKRINRGQGNYSYVANSPHYVECSHESCVEKYYTCQYSTCPYSNMHVSFTPPTDNTPSCSGCTTDCSYPCGCSGSGTCGGSNMPTPTDNTPNCSGCTSHCSSPCSCSDSGTCNGTVASPPPTPPPPSGPTCPSGHTYDPNNSSQVDRHMVERTCRRSGCGQTWYRCVGKPASCKVSTDPCWASNP